ncbi:hypothetical protein FGL91_06075 [Microbacterium sp. CBA3102]|nr:hypothetical protein FGL91_06075 [Microbacterium sp. CBA3102]
MVVGEWFSEGGCRGVVVRGWLSGGGCRGVVVGEWLSEIGPRRAVISAVLRALNRQGWHPRPCRRPRTPTQPTA